MDAFVTKIDTTRAGASNLIYSTYLGGNEGDVGQNIAVDRSGHAYVTGETSSPDFPILDQFQEYQASTDVFVTKIDTTRSGTLSLIYATCLGGSSYDFGYGIAIDSWGDVYITGETYSSDFPILNQYQVDQGDRDSFTTKLSYKAVPSVITAEISFITATSATCGGRVTSDGGAAVTHRGVCWNITGNPTTADMITVDGSGTGSFTSYITGLTADTNYFVRAYAKNARGTGYGKTRKFKTLNNPSILGTIKSSSGTAVVGVILTFSNSGGTTKTNRDGYYRHPVEKNWSGTVTPSKTGYVFKPAQRAYNKVTSDFSGQDFTAYHVVLSLHATRETESAWIISRQYGKMELKFINPGQISVAKYIIYRKESGGIYTPLIEIPGAQIQDSPNIHYDRYLDKNKTYTYKFTAMDKTGLKIAVSNEKTI